MYPYEHYSMGEGMMVYNHDGSPENELAINIDKEINHITHFHTYTRMYDLFNNDSIEFDNMVKTIISNWMYEDKYQHIELIAKYYNQILSNEKFVASCF